MFCTQNAKPSDFCTKMLRVRYERFCILCTEPFFLLLNLKGFVQNLKRFRSSAESFLPFLRFGDIPFFSRLY
jgi:hypothetical protein